MREAIALAPDAPAKQDRASHDDAFPSMSDIPADALSRDLPITNKRGLHARASAKLVQTVEAFAGGAEVWVSRAGETVGGMSIMGLMMLAASPGTSITVHAAGPRAAEALAAIAALVLDKFGEGE